MAPQETAKLDAILEQVGEHRVDFQIFRTQILGDPEDEKPTGRLPMLEARSHSHEKRITRLERLALMVVGAAGLLKLLAIGAESLAHIVEVFKH